MQDLVVQNFERFLESGVDGLQNVVDTSAGY